MEEHDSIYGELDGLYDSAKRMRERISLLEYAKRSMQHEIDAITDAIRAAGIKYPLVDRAETVEEGREAAGAL